jgi:hypothetical protein
MMTVILHGHVPARNALPLPLTIQRIVREVALH